MTGSPDRSTRLDIPEPELLPLLLEASLPLGLRARVIERSFHRDLFLDTPDGGLAARGITCRFRIGADDRRRLTIDVAAEARFPASQRARYDAMVNDTDIWRALEGSSGPARRLRGLVDPAHVEVVVQVETERHVRRTADSLQWLRGPRFAFVYDRCTVRGKARSREFMELSIRRLRPGGPQRSDLARALQAQHGLRPLVASTRERAQLLLRWLEHEEETIAVGAKRLVVLIGERDGLVALQANGGRPELPAAEGSGESACRALMCRLFGSGGGALQLVGSAPPNDRRPMLEVWLAPDVRPADAGGIPGGATLQWMPLHEVMDSGGGGSHAAITAAALGILRQSALPGLHGSDGRVMPRASAFREHETVAEIERVEGAPLICAALSELEFHARVIEMAEDERLPLLERLRFLAISGSNLDEFFSVRVAALVAAGSRARDDDADDDDGLTASQRLDSIRQRMPEVLRRQQRCWQECRRELAAEGILVRAWSELDGATAAELREYFREEIYPALTPLAITVSAGHPFPRLSHLSLSIAVVLTEPGAGGANLVQIEIPPIIPRLVPTSGGDYVPVEEIIRANLDVLYPDCRLEDVSVFRITRRAGMGMVRQGGARLLQAMEAAAGRRGGGAVVRIEVERGIPGLLRELLLRELQREQPPGSPPLTEADVYEVDGLLDLGALRRLAEVDRPALRFPPFRGRSPLGAQQSLWEMLAERDVLVHHPYDDFGATTLRFLWDAAEDPAVVAMKLTLYRAGKRAPVVEALLHAAAAGKEVAVFVELKARFDEEHNVRWAKALEQAGIHVVYGVRGLKTHAKVALVVRREGGRLRRYVHVGTGNYNAETARSYTDLGLLSGDEALGADVNDLFNELTGSSRGPRRLPRQCLTAPRHLLPALLSRIAREAEHARSGRGGRIRAKLNGLSDGEIVRALYEASRAGVEVELIVRGVCTLRPGVVGSSERIRVVSCLGRFLEHARIYHFANAGSPEYFIGSADWRRRNLRRRVELVAPVTDPGCQARLDRILDLELRDTLAWELRPDGSYRRRTGELGQSAQELLLRDGGR